MAGEEIDMEHPLSPIIQGTFLIHKMPGKGGWSFVTFEPVDKQYRGKFGVVSVWGTLDGFQLENYGLMPMKNGGLFLPVKAEIRKQIGKQAGDWIAVCLYAKTVSRASEEDLLLCLQDEPEIYERFKTYTTTEKQAFMDWVNAAKDDEQRAGRIADAIDMISSGLKRH